MASHGVCFLRQAFISVCSILCLTTENLSAFVPIQRQLRSFQIQNIQNLFYWCAENTVFLWKSEENEISIIIRRHAWSILIWDNISRTMICYFQNHYSSHYSGADFLNLSALSWHFYHKLIKFQSNNTKRSCCNLSFVIDHAKDILMLIIYGF